MVRRRTTNTFNMNAVIDTAIAGLIVQKIPGLITSFTKIDFGQTINPIVGGGIGFLVGKMFGRPMLSNASIALAISSFVLNLLPDFSQPIVKLPAGQSSGSPLVTKEKTKEVVPY